MGPERTRSTSARPSTRTPTSAGGSRSSITQLVPQGFNFTNSDSIGGGGLVVLNDVRATSRRTSSNSTVEAAQPRRARYEQAFVRALADATVSSSGGSSWNGEGKSLAVNAVIATNRVLSRRARVRRRRARSTTTVGDLTVDAQNASQIDATTLAATSTGTRSVGILLAFNTVGWNPSNLLFAAIDALLGDPLISEAFHGENPAETLAYVKGTPLTLAGGAHGLGAHATRV